MGRFIVVYQLYINCLIFVTSTSSMAASVCGHRLEGLCSMLGLFGTDDVFYCTMYGVKPSDT